MTNQVEIQKPIILEMDEVKKEIVDLVNKSIQVRKLPFYFIDLILSDVCAQIKEGAKNEIMVAREQMAQNNKSNMNKQ